MAQNPKIEMRTLDTIRPYENNARRNERAIKDVATSIRKYGFNQPIVVDKDGVIVVGHTRYEAAKKLGLSVVPVLVSDLPEKKNREYRIADNKTNELASWDFDKLAQEIADLDFSEFDFEMPTFDIDDLDSLFTEAPQQRETPPAPGTYPAEATNPQPIHATPGSQTPQQSNGDGAESFDFPREARQIQCPHCGQWFTLP